MQAGLAGAGLVLVFGAGVGGDDLGVSEFLLPLAQDVVAQARVAPA